MKAVKYIIVEADQDYNNEVTLSTGHNIVVNTTIESVANINRVVKVVSVPEGIILQPDDYIIVHHNILRRKNDTKGNEIKSDYWIEGNYYFVPPMEVFTYKRNGKWYGLDPFVFIEPIKETPKISNTGIFLESGNKTQMVKNTGYIRVINKELESWGLKEGDKVYFKDDSEYEFDIDGQTLYRMKTSDILGQFE